MKAARRPKPSKGRIARPVRADELTALPAAGTYRLGHWWSLHEYVEEHDWEWYTRGGRRFYSTTTGRELGTLRDVERAIQADGWVESQ